VTRRRPTRSWTVALALTALGATLRFATLDGQSFWLDELVTVSLLDRDFGDMLAEIRRSEATPYLYYLLAWPWARVAGLGEVGLRSLSAAFGTLTIPIAYAAGAALATRRVGLVAAALVTVHPLLVWYSQEARSYALLVLLGALSVLFLARALDASRPSDLVGWALASSLAIATHYFAIFLVLAEAGWLLARVPPRRAAVAASLVPLAALAAHLPLLVAQRDNGSAVADTSLLSRLAGVPKGLVVGYSFPLEVAGSLLAAALVLVGLALAVTRTPPGVRPGLLAAGSVAVAAMGAPLVGALAGADYVIARNLVTAIVPGAICLGVGYASGRLGLAAGGVLCALLLAVTLGVSLDERYGRTDWRGAAARLDDPGHARAIVVTPYMSRLLWSPYLPGLEEPSGRQAVVEEIAVVGLATEGGFSGGPVEPPAVAPPPPPAGFALVEADRAGTMTLYRYSAVRPTPVSTSTLAAMRLADQQPGILLQRPPVRTEAQTLGPRGWLASPG
jgi:hypothetical protein